MKHTLTTGSEVITPQRPATLERIKTGNLLKKDYEVRFPNGDKRWYSKYELDKAFKMAA